MSFIGRIRTLTMTASQETIERLHWQAFLGGCGYETTVKAVTDSRQVFSVKRRGKRYNFDVNRISPNSVELSATEVRFPIARLLGCLGFRLHLNDSKNVAFEIFEIKLEEGLFRKLEILCTSVKPDTNTPESDEIIELIYKSSPNLLLPAKSNSRTKHAFAHFAIVDGMQFLAVSSNRYNYDDWLGLEQFKAIRKTIHEFGGNQLNFLTGKSKTAIE